MSQAIDQAPPGPGTPVPAAPLPPGSEDVDTAASPEPRRQNFLRRHRAAGITVAVLVAVLLLGGSAFVYQTYHAGPHELSTSTALQRFRSGVMILVDPGALHPNEGVYTYTGEASEHVSFPPMTHVEGPRFPGTVSYLRNGCWVFRLDYSNLHWQSNTYCPRHGDLVGAGRAGWYKWNFLAISVADTATFTCQEMAIPAAMSVGERFAFGCTGNNDPLDTGVVTMSGTYQYVGPQTLRIAGTAVATVHFREVARLGGGQSGTSVADTWFSTVNGLPVHGTWSTAVKSPSPLGTSTLTGSGSFTVSSLTPRT